MIDFIWKENPRPDLEPEILEKLKQQVDYVRNLSLGNNIFDTDGCRSDIDVDEMNIDDLKDIRDVIIILDENNYYGKGVKLNFCDRKLEAKIINLKWREVSSRSDFVPL